MRPTNLRTASQTLLKLRVGSPQALQISNQCCTKAANNLPHTRTICRTSVEPLKTATLSWDFQRLNSNSTCQRARYKITASSGLSFSDGTLVTRIVQSHQARRAALGCLPYLLCDSLFSFCRRRFACSDGKRQANRRHGNRSVKPSKIDTSTNGPLCRDSQANKSSIFSLSRSKTPVRNSEKI